MNFKEIVEELERQEIGKSEFAYGDFGQRTYPNAKYDTPEYNTATVDNLGEVVKVYHYGGEGQGDVFETVQYFKDHDVYIKIEGFYSSYNGVDYDAYDFEEVVPAEKVITVYEKK